MDVSVGRPVARDFSYRNEWRFINIIIERVRACVRINLLLPSLSRMYTVHTHTHAHTFIIVYDRFIRLTLPNDCRADRMIDGLQLDGSLYIFCPSLCRRHRPRIVVGPRARAHTHTHLLNFGYWF